jgi:hypothetical protein
MSSCFGRAWRPLDIDPGDGDGAPRPHDAPGVDTLTSRLLGLTTAAALVTEATELVTVTV